jgi:hypothetical protein
VVVQGDGSLTHDAVLCPDELPAYTRHVLEGRSSEVVFRLRLLWWQDQIPEQPAQQPCQHAVQPAPYAEPGVTPQTKSDTAAEHTSGP